MNEIASTAQLRMSFLRWALVTVPLVTFLGYLSGSLSRSGYSNRWFAALAKPDIMPPNSAFPIAWTTLYIMMGLAIAIVLNARGARLRGVAIAFFIAQLLANYAWSPLFFTYHQVHAAFFLILVIFGLAVITTWLFARIRPLAALLMMPYLGWLVFAALLNQQFDRLNPDAANLAVPALNIQIGG